MCINWLNLVYISNIIDIFCIYVFSKWLDARILIAAAVALLLVLILLL